MVYVMQIGGSGVLVQPMTYIFDEEPERWLKVLAALDLDASDPLVAGSEA
jgi:ATP phosphoribosyltransferase